MLRNKWEICYRDKFCFLPDLQTETFLVYTYRDFATLAAEMQGEINPQAVMSVCGVADLMQVRVRILN